MASKKPTVSNAASLLLHFNVNDTTGRGCVFLAKAPKAKSAEVYFRAKVENPTLINAGFCRLFLTRLERVGAKGKLEMLCDDTLELNWSASGGEDREFWADFEHYCDVVSFVEGAKAFKIASLCTPTHFKTELAKAGIYRFHLLLSGENAKPQRAIMEMKWPAKPAKGSYANSLSFSLTK